MNQRTAGIAGIAVLGVAAIGLLAPAAVADPGTVTLAPGVECTGLVCRNDTDRTYRIDWTATCAYPDGLTTTVPAQTWIAPHEQIFQDVANCPLLQGPRHPEVSSGVASAQYLRAVPDNSHPPAPPFPPTGSAG